MDTISQSTEPSSPRIVGRATVAMPVAVAGREASAAYDADGTITIGRGPRNDIVLKELLVSRRHAEVRRSGAGYVVVDLGSSNGTYLNGKQVSREPLQPGDLLSIGRHQFVFDGDRLHEYLDTGPTSLVVEDLSVTIGRQLLLSDVTFGLAEGSLLGVIGPSGCGKSTLLRAVTGIRPASGGTIRYDGRDLYSQYAELRYRIGMVPQDDVLHRQLTVQRALRFAAALRFADDVPRRERKARVAEVVATLGLTERARQRIDTLSGGQRKRTSVALELLTEPSMLCLDEPTSGLDPALDREVMRELRQLADRGATAVVVTHNVLHLDLCDRVLIMCPGGTMGYFGPPEDVLEFFGAEDYADVFDMITNKPEEWTRRYRESDHYRRWATAGVRPSASSPAAASAATPAAAPASAGSASAPGSVSAGAAPTAAVSRGTGAAASQGSHPTAPEGADPDTSRGSTPGAPSATGVAAGNAGSPDPAPPVVGRARPVAANLRGLPLRNRAMHPAAPLRQYLTLCLRMVRVIVSDRGYALFLLGLPVALAVLTHAVPGDYGLSNPPPPLYGRSLEAQRLIVVLVMGAAFLGIAPAIREIVQEATIYRRERAVGLSPGAYLASKITVFAVINALQVVVFVYLALLGRGAPSEYLVIANPTLEVMVAVALVAVACTILGLVISALVKTVEQTTPVLVMVVMAQLILSGGLFEANGQRILEQVSWISQTRWGFAAAASTVDLTHLAPVQDHLWVHTVFAWWRSIVVLIVQGIVLAAAARVALVRHEPGRS
ncbi:ATP-binding cassette domain-containing protein [Rugosimonospora acidiphila]|uniref:ATP-binding cassette domain-containing protein n=1 Tax=Rugosimonospora acidiphila TaxID=556531 RepID=UPI0031E8B6E5